MRKRQCPKCKGRGDVVKWGPVLHSRINEARNANGFLIAREKIMTRVGDREKCRKCGLTWNHKTADHHPYEKRIPTPQSLNDVTEEQFNKMLNILREVSLKFGIENSPFLLVDKELGWAKGTTIHFFHYAVQRGVRSLDIIADGKPALKNVPYMPLICDSIIWFNLWWYHQRFITEVLKLKSGTPNHKFKTLFSSAEFLSSWAGLSFALRTEIKKVSGVREMRVTEKCKKFFDGSAVEYNLEAETTRTRAFLSITKGLFK